MEIFLDDCMNVMPKIEDKSVDLVLTDIPYNEVNRESNGLKDLDRGESDVMKFDIEKFLSECSRVCRGSFYIFCGISQVSLIKNFFASRKLPLRHCIWEKTNPSVLNGQHMWISSIENCIFAKNRSAVFNEHCKSCVWRFSGGRKKTHPTEKPIKLFEYLVRCSSNENDVVLDPCMGSGTTGLACQKLNRKFIGVEVNKEYFKTAQVRLGLISPVHTDTCH